ncbi:precorrin-2 dehydrogenase/sirohydrochlorin ferrochelatase family protein [Deinococcus aquaedulcis]|uniref:precorrin-2 dehydrogenase/sirohydrochlorin ferrochelatase family protein n=1 Tax=Deinococcus aquaedulcis TaxID=2840455 RepID=UPI002E2BC99E|nr:bifunctional precorrin-2 dehydrogenase/sirohydrochlorin ferrochelatase [Deinococcus aquaedulcis]
MSLLPAFLDLRGERAVIVGGGRVALRRAHTLLRAGLSVTVVAPEVQADLKALPVTVLARPYAHGDLHGAALVVAATPDARVNAQVVAEARAQGSLVNDAADAARGSLRFAAVAEEAGVQVAVSTGRELPMLAQALAQRCAELLPTEAQLGRWTAQREAALTLPEPQKHAALDTLRADIRRALGAA